MKQVLALSINMKKISTWILPHSTKGQKGPLMPCQIAAKKQTIPDRFLTF